MVYRLCGVGSRTMSLSWLMFGRSSKVRAHQERGLLTSRVPVKKHRGSRENFV
jgi:hypothetical protein